MKITTINLDAVTSTQDHAKRLAEEGAPEGTVVVARTQERGRGRLGRRWISPEGGLWFSLVLRPDCRPAKVAGLTLLAAVSVTEAVNDTASLKAGIKWPNDILVGGKKLGGILTEMAAEMNVVKYVVVGVGLNVNVETADFPHDLLMPATSISDETGREFDLVDLMHTCLSNLSRDYSLYKDNFADILSRWKGMSVVIGRPVKISQPGSTITGRAIDVDADGALLIVDGEGATITVHAGDLSILR